MLRLVVESIEPFGLTLLIVAVAVSVALLSNRISSRLRIPARRRSSWSGRPPPPISSRH